jgi:hypothetical protein
MSADLAAGYVGVCKTTFLGGVERGDWPAPVRQGRRVLWDRQSLDAAVDRLSGRVPVNEDGKEWMEAVNGSR